MQYARYILNSAAYAPRPGPGAAPERLFEASPAADPSNGQSPHGSEPVGSSFASGPRFVGQCSSRRAPERTGERTNTGNDTRWDGTPPRGDDDDGGFFAEEGPFTASGRVQLDDLDAFMVESRPDFLNRSDSDEELDLLDPYYAHYAGRNSTSGVIISALRRHRGQRSQVRLLSASDLGHRSGIVSLPSIVAEGLFAEPYDDITSALDHVSPLLPQPPSLGSAFEMMSGDENWKYHHLSSTMSSAYPQEADFSLTQRDDKTALSASPDSPKSPSRREAWISRFHRFQDAVADMDLSNLFGANQKHNDTNMDAKMDVNDASPVGDSPRTLDRSPDTDAIHDASPIDLVSPPLEVFSKWSMSPIQLLNQFLRPTSQEKQKQDTDKNIIQSENNNVKSASATTHVSNLSNASECSSNPLSSRTHTVYFDAISSPPTALSGPNDVNTVRETVEASPLTSLDDDINSIDRHQQNMSSSRVISSVTLQERSAFPESTVPSNTTPPPYRPSSSFARLEGIFSQDLEAGPMPRAARWNLPLLSSINKNHSLLPTTSTLYPPSSTVTSTLRHDIVLSAIAHVLTPPQVPTSEHSEYPDQDHDDQSHLLSAPTMDPLAQQRAAYASNPLTHGLLHTLVQD